MLYPKITIENKERTNLFHTIGRIIPEFSVLNQVIIRANQNTRTFNVNSKVYEEIGQSVGISKFTVRNIIDKFKDSGFLYKVQQGVYLLNKELIELDYKKGVWIENNKST